MDSKEAPKSWKARLRELQKERALERKEKSKEEPVAAKSGKEGSAYPWATPDDVNYIDSKLAELWKELGFAPTEQASEGEFVRRASLDIIGRIPTLAETQAYLSDHSSDKREKLINRLLASDEYGKNWANVWTNLLTPVGPNDQANGANRNINPPGMQSWLEKQFNRNVPWNNVVKELIAGSGRWDENGATNFAIAKIQEGNREHRTSDFTAFLTKYFLCVQTQCTECHDHPWNEWKQDQFHGIDAFFRNTHERRITTTAPNGQVVTDYYELEEEPVASLADIGTFFERRNGLVVMVPPTYLDGRDIRSIMRGEKARVPGVATDPLLSASFQFDVDAESQQDSRPQPIYLRRVLADVITADDNPYFARSIVNRLWYHYFGHSFIKNVDDFDNGQDEPTMPELLDKLAEDYKAHGHDLKRLHRWIATSKAYAASTIRKNEKTSEDAVGFFTFQLIKPMTPVQLYDSIVTLTRIDKASKTMNASESRERFLREIERTFASTETPTGTPRYDGTITQALMMMNSPLMTEACACQPGTFLHSVVFDNSLNNSAAVDAIFLAAVSRKPTRAEQTQIDALFRASSRPDALSDVLWALVNSAEFVLNH